MASLLQSVLRQLTSTCVEVGEDAALLRRFVEDGDHPAFAVLVQRHGGLVWGVCRQMLPSEADAEDAFQATFLALVRSARAALTAKALGGWLHGVAVKVCLKSRRAAARLRRREERAAKREGVLPGELAWDDLHAAVHQEVEKLPAAHRAALVLCDLQGVRQFDAAAQLGWKLGTLTGRLARARQQLMKRLTARGLAPSAVAGAVVLGGSASAAPPILADKVLSLAAGGAIPSAVLTLTKSVLEATLMKVKLLAAAVLTATGLALTAGWVATADAQSAAGGLPPGATPGGPSSGTGSLPTGVGGGEGSAAGPGTGLPGSGGSGAGRPGMSGPGAAGPGMPGMGTGSAAAPQPRVEHALVDLPDTEKKLTELFNKRQADGWEFAGQVGQMAPGGYIKLAFKRPTAKAGLGALPGGMLMPGITPGGMGTLPAMPGPGPVTQVGSAPKTGGLGGDGSEGPSTRGGGGAGRAPATDVNIITLKNAAAADLAVALGQLFRGTDVTVIAEPSSNTLLVRASPAVLLEIAAVVAKLEQIGRPETVKPGTSGKPGK